MYRRLIILTAIVVAAVCGLGGLGFHAIAKWAEGLEGVRLGEFAEVAEQVRQDVKRKLDEFIEVEQQRKYSDYLYSYVPENIVDAQQLSLVRSPLGDRMSNEFAYGYFQVEPDGTIVTPYSPGRPSDSNGQNELAQAVAHHFSNVVENVLPSISLRAGGPEVPAVESDVPDRNNATTPTVLAKDEATSKVPTMRKGGQERLGNRSQAYPIESFKQKAQQTQVYESRRSIIASNWAQVPSPPADQVTQTASPQAQTSAIDKILPGLAQQQVQADLPQQAAPSPPASDTVQIRMEPFVPLVVPAPRRTESIFGGQVFLLRHVQIESRHLLQGFQLDEQRLIAEVETSARSFVREGMGFELPQVRKANGQAGDRDEQPAYAAILDFGFGDLILNLRELDPAWIARRIGDLRHLYFAILATVVAAVGLALVSLWHNVRAQVVLAQKKDDFISAVSHELRTPLTSIRMYAEMLEKNWVKSQDKVAEYHRTMRQESERLSRLVENVLDFARLQKGRKSYAFRLGDIDECVAGVVEMMRPYAQQQGFTIRTFLAAGQCRFDKDAVTQIVVNLVDNAVKYARGAADKTIVVRTRNEPGLTILEVEDRGPGIPHHLRRKVFDQFYRCDDVPAGAGRPASDAGRPPSVTPTTGVGLGLTLVKRFAEAHGGYVEILPAQPTGTILRVGLCPEGRPAT
jgi:signal transduction histidine kinase